MVYTKKMHRLLTAAQEARDHAERCGWPECACPETKPGEVRCPATGATVHFRRPSDPDA